MLAEIFMLRCEAAARNTQSEHAANEAAARWVGLRRKLATGWNGVRSLSASTGQHDSVDKRLERSSPRG
jgi:hypothetical protein